MAEKVGKFHIHELPDIKDVPLRDDVYRCSCGTEYYAEKAARSGISVPEKEWKPISSLSAGNPVHYDKTVEGKTFIGFATSETKFDEEVANDEATGDSGEAVPEHSDSGSSD